ncbi:MAG: aldehyde dehydrogenase family protein [Polyangiaceae bacterium]|nr:aldehyde dehydrogenase family protein [Polyangiaceae bacterium]
MTDLDDAVAAAKKAQAVWESCTAQSRGQILYRLAEMMESRRVELAEALRCGGLPVDAAVTEVDASIDRVVFYAGFADKVASLLGSHNPVPGPYFSASVSEPVGVVGVIAPSSPSLLGLVSTALPVLTGGNSVVLLASEKDPAIVLCECVAMSDMPSGVLNVLTDSAEELWASLAKHREIVGIDAWVADAEIRKMIESAGADGAKRVRTHVPMDSKTWFDERRGQGLHWVEHFLETKTIWHPTGL